MNNIVYILDIEQEKTRKKSAKSIKSWQHFCDKYGHTLVTMDEPVTDSTAIPLSWQKYFVFDILKHNEIKFDQICIVDANTIVHPDTPDFFNLTNGKYTVVSEDGNFDYIIRSIENYNKFLFPDQPIFNWYEYFNSDIQVVNKSHKSFFKSMIDFYIEKSNIVNWCEQTYKNGIETTPFNYLLRKAKIETTILSYKFNMNNLATKECLNEEMLHTRAGYVMHFNNMPDSTNSVPYWIEKTYNYLYESRNNR